MNRLPKVSEGTMQRLIDEMKQNAPNNTCSDFMKEFLAGDPVMRSVVMVIVSDFMPMVAEQGLEKALLQVITQVLLPINKALEEQELARLMPIKEAKS